MCPGLRDKWRRMVRMSRVDNRGKKYRKCLKGIERWSKYCIFENLNI